MEMQKEVEREREREPRKKKKKRKRRRRRVAFLFPPMHTSVHSGVNKRRGCTQHILFSSPEYPTSQIWVVEEAVRGKERRGGWREVKSQWERREGRRLRVEKKM